MISGNRTIMIGDSITTHGATENYAGIWAWPTYACWHSNGALFWLRNAGVSGNTLTQMNTRFAADVLAYNPQLILIMGGTNDADTSSLVTMQTQMTAMVNKAYAANIPVAVCAIPPLGAPTETQKLRIAQFNAWLAVWASGRQGIHFIDIHTPLTDPTTGLPLTGMIQVDNAHPTGKGARTMGETVANALAPYMALTHLPTAPSKVYALNLISNGTFNGDANVDGVADNWDRWGSGGTVTLQNDPGLTGAKVQRVVLAALGSSGRDGVSQAFGSISAGDRLRCSAYLATSGTEAGPAEAAFYLTWGAPDSSAQGMVSSLGDTSGVMAMDVTVPAGVSDARISIDIGCSATVTTATGTLEVGRVSVINLTALGLA